MDRSGFHDRHRFLYRIHQLDHLEKGQRCQGPLPAEQPRCEDRAGVRSRPWWFAALAALSLGLSLFITVANLDFKPAVRYSQVFVYLGLGIFSLAMVGQALTDSEIVYSQDAFMLVTEPIRFRNVNKVEVTKGILSPCTMTLAGNKEEVLPKTVARWLSAQLQTWKKEKKAAKRAPRGRQK